MKVYYMNEDVNDFTGVVDDSNTPSQYQDAIDAFLEAGGHVKTIETSRRSLDVWDVPEKPHIELPTSIDKAPRGAGDCIMDQRAKEKDHDIQKFFD